MSEKDVGQRLKYEGKITTGTKRSLIISSVLRFAKYQNTKMESLQSITFVPSFRSLEVTGLWTPVTRECQSREIQVEVPRRVTGRSLGRRLPFPRDMDVH